MLNLVKGNYEVVNDTFMFTFEGTLKQKYNFENFDTFETYIWAECLKPSINELAQKMFSKLQSLNASNTSMDSAYGSDKIDVDASHKLLGPAIDSCYDSNEPVPADLEDFFNAFRPENGHF